MIYLEWPYFLSNENIIKCYEEIKTIFLKNNLNETEIIEEEEETAEEKEKKKKKKEEVGKFSDDGQIEYKINEDGSNEIIGATLYKLVENLFLGIKESNVFFLTYLSFTTTEQVLIEIKKISNEYMKKVDEDNNILKNFLRLGFFYF
jgi:hypothetical protein